VSPSGPSPAQTGNGGICVLIPAKDLHYCYRWIEIDGVQQIIEGSLVVH
jgi:hypothetical protein